MVILYVLEQVFCSCFLNAVYKLRKPCAFKNFAVTPPPFKTNNYFTCVSICIDLILCYVDSFCLVYQRVYSGKPKVRTVT